MGKIKDEIAKFLKQNNMCVLSTCRKDEPRATPVTYWSDGLTVNIFSEKFTSKFEFLEKNLKVAIGIYASNHPPRGLQLWGKAEIIDHEDPRHDRRMPRRAKENPKYESLRKIVKLLQITPWKIVVVDGSRKGKTFLKWEVDRNGKEIEKEIKTLRGASQL